MKRETERLRLATSTASRGGGLRRPLFCPIVMGAG
jgi:hypothetical protein